MLTAFDVCTYNLDFDIRLRCLCRKCDQRIIFQKREREQIALLAFSYLNFYLRTRSAIQHV